ncbi:MBL fold metallo-hydrolase [Kordia sp. TARA_039_SRF]|nr:MBL fold metallo-hydrolase [Kordia sp. TARA_039_SRF]
MEVKFLKAGTGDSILIHHKSHNILIDGGNDSSYMLKQVEEIYERKEIIDLLIITHHDDDHIKGIIDLLKLIKQGKFGEGNKFIKKVFFNSPRLILKKISSKKERSQLSYKQAYEVEELFQKLGIKWELCTDETETEVYGNLKMHFLSPTKEIIQEYSEHKDVYLTSDYRCDWEVSMVTLERALDKSKSQDRSLPNQTSIVVLLECDNKKVLLTGDVTPNRFESLITELVSENNDNPVYFDYVKLPHHGSYKSLNSRIMSNIDCANYIFSTNGSKYYHPNKRAILQVLKSPNKKQKNFFFNYEEAMSNLIITDKEKRDYNFKLISNNQDYGFSI